MFRFLSFLLRACLSLLALRLSSLTLPFRGRAGDHLKDVTRPSQIKWFITPPPPPPPVPCLLLLLFLLLRPSFLFRLLLSPSLFSFSLLLSSYSFSFTTYPTSTSLSSSPPSSLLPFFFLLLFPRRHLPFLVFPVNTTFLRATKRRERQRQSPTPDSLTRFPLGSPLAEARAAPRDSRTHLQK